MPKTVQCYAGAITFGDLAGRMDMLRVACSKCERAGQYSVAKLIERHGPRMGLPKWKDDITADCPMRTKPGNTWDRCGARFPDLPKMMTGR
jgi:hypothetical protein